MTTFVIAADSPPSPPGTRRIGPRKRGTAGGYQNLPCIPVRPLLINPTVLTLMCSIVEMTTAALGGGSSTLQFRERVQTAGSDCSILARYCKYLGHVTSDFGTTIRNTRPVTTVTAVRRASAGIFPELTLIVGESGGDKTVTARMIPGFPSEMATASGVGLRANGKYTRATAKAKAVEFLEKVGNPEPHVPVNFSRYQFSDAQKQRVVITSALVLDPELNSAILADRVASIYEGKVAEKADATGGFSRPGFRAVSSVSFQIETREVRGLVGESGTRKTTIGRAIGGLTRVTRGSFRVLGQGMPGVKERTFHRMTVLYRGELAEEGTGAEVLGAPKHPYTRRLLASLPVPNPAEQATRREQLRMLRAEA